MENRVVNAENENTTTTATSTASVAAAGAAAAPDLNQHYQQHFQQHYASTAAAAQQPLTALQQQPPIQHAQSSITYQTNAPFGNITNQLCFIKNILVFFINLILEYSIMLSFGWVLR